MTCVEFLVKLSFMVSFVAVIYLHTYLNRKRTHCGCVAGVCDSDLYWKIRPHFEFIGWKARTATVTCSSLQMLALLPLRLQTPASVCDPDYDEVVGNRRWMENIGCMSFDFFSLNHKFKRVTLL